MHIIFFNSKGGVGKSTLCHFLQTNLRRLGRRVSTENCDQQCHVQTVHSENAECALYDTTGAYTEMNLKLLSLAKSASENGERVLVIVPTTTSVNDLKEIHTVIRKIRELGLDELVILTQVRTNLRSTQEKKEELIACGYRISDWLMPLWEDYAQQRQTNKTQQNIEMLIKELRL